MQIVIDYVPDKSGQPQMRIRSSDDVTGAVNVAGILAQATHFAVMRIAQEEEEKKGPKVQVPTPELAEKLLASVDGEKAG